MVIEPSMIEKGKSAYRFSDDEKQMIAKALYSEADFIYDCIQDICFNENTHYKGTAAEVISLGAEAKQLKEIADMFSNIKRKTLLLSDLTFIAKTLEGDKEIEMSFSQIGSICTDDDVFYCNSPCPILMSVACRLSSLAVIIP